MSGKIGQVAVVDDCIAELTTSIEQLLDASKEAARKRNDILLSTFNAYKSEMERINQSQSELKIEISFKGDREGFKAQMKSDFR